MADYIELRELALENLLTANLAFEHELYNTAVENCHFALEKIMKSAIYKHGGQPPRTAREGHDLVKIANTRIRKKKFLYNEIKRNPIMLKYWTQVRSFWKTHQRYVKLKVDPLDVGDIITSYERLVRWIDNNFVN